MGTGRCSVRRGAGGRLLHILLLQDDEQDIAQLQQAFAELPGDVELHVARNGPGADAALASDPRINLVLLADSLSEQASLPWLTGLKAHTDLGLRRLPVVMLSGDSAEEQIRSAYHAYASAYLIRPDTAAGLSDMVGALVEFWGQVARLPSRV
jgi:DNA-binding NarL/FixJ family response regulator